MNAKHPWHRLASRHLTSLVLRRWSSLRWESVWSTAWSCKLIAFRVSRTGTHRRRRQTQHPQGGCCRKLITSRTGLPGAQQSLPPTV